MDTSNVIMNCSNIRNLCYITNKNKELQETIDKQTNTIGILIQEKNSLMDQYQNLLISLENRNTSNLESNI